MEYSLIFVQVLGEHHIVYYLYYFKPTSFSLGMFLFKIDKGIVSTSLRTYQTLILARPVEFSFLMVYENSFLMYCGFHSFLIVI